MIVLQVLALGAAVTVALFYFGYGLTRLVLPNALAAWRWHITPLAGIAVTAVWDYGALFFGFNLMGATFALLAAATLVNLLALRKVRWRPPRPGRAQLIIAAVALVVFLVSVAPLFRYGYITLIGENWDYEFYLPLADALRTLPTGALAQAPSNPLMTTVLSRHILPLPMGFSYVQASLDVLLGADALDTFAVLLAVLHALGILSAYVFFRAALKMSERAALVASMLLAANGLLLWLTYWNFGLHLASLALLPIAVTLGVGALLDTDDVAGSRVRYILAAALFLAGLNVTYHPSLIAALLPLGAVGIYALVARAERGRTLLTGAALVGLTLALSFPTLFHLEDFRREFYGRTPLAIGLREFVPLSDAYGVSLYLLDLAVGHTIPTPWLYASITQVWNLTAPWLTFAAVGASLFALWQLRRDRERRVVWYCLVGAAVVYVAVFRLPFLRPYPYGFLKSLSLAAFVLTALVVQGGEYLFQISPQTLGFGGDLTYRIFRGALYLVTALFALSIAATFALSFEQYFKPAPAFFRADDLKLRELSAIIPQGAEVFLTDRSEVQKIPMGLAAYALQDYALRGKVTTGYGALDNAELGAVYEYGLLARGEDPTARGYQVDPLWSNARFALYPREAGVTFQQRLDVSTVAPEPLTLTLGVDVVSDDADKLQAAGRRDLRAALATFVPQTVTLDVGGRTVEQTLAPGLTAIEIKDVALPAKLTITPTVESSLLAAAQPPLPHSPRGADAALYVPWIQMRTPGAGEQAASLTDAVLVRCYAAPHPNGPLTARCFVANPGKESLRWVWILRGTPQGTREERVMAQGEITGSPSKWLDIGASIEYGLEYLQLDEAPPARFAPQSSPDGKYYGALEVFRDDVLLARIPLYTAVSEEAGAKVNVDTRGAPLTVIMP